MLLNGVRGELAEWLRSGLQIRLHRFDSGTRLHLPAIALIPSKIIVLYGLQGPIFLNFSDLLF